ncbi:MAG: hypothetical protein JXA13_01615 [Anaerolineales bacterium]|nr:hypothetical protein [Anaerolineales bacterium]
MNQAQKTLYIKVSLIVLALLVLAVSTAPGQPALAQGTGGILYQKQIGFDGYCKQHQLVPLQIILENTGKNLDLRVQVSSTSLGSGKHTIEREIPLASSSRKKITLYIPFREYNRELTIRILEGSKELVKDKARLQCLDSNNTLIGVLSNSPAYDVMREMEIVYGEASLAYLDIEDLPDQVQGWLNLDGLVIAGQDTGDLNSSQQEALELWLAKGGRLLVIGGPEWQPSIAGLPEDILPLAVSKTVVLDPLAALSAGTDTTQLPVSTTVIATGNLTPGASVLAEQDGNILLAKKAIGFGSVYYLAADPNLEPLHRWDEITLLYTRIFTTAAAPPAWSNNIWNDEQANRALATLEELKVPSLPAIILWLLVYIVVIGPLNFLGVHLAKRRELAWLTTPTLVFVFLMIAFSTGAVFRGTTPIVNRLVVVQAWDSVDSAYANGLVGIYSPVRKKYTLEAKGPFLFMPIDDRETLQTGDNWLSNQRGNANTLPDVQVEIGGMKTTSAAGMVPSLAISHDLKLTLSGVSPGLEGTIVNNSSQPLKDAFLVAPGRIIDIGHLGPGQSYNLRTNFPHYGSGEHLSDRYLGYYGHDELVEHRNLLLEASMDHIPYQGIYLMGWIEINSLPVTLEDADYEVLDIVLYAHQLKPEIETSDREFVIPASMFTWETLDESISPGYMYLSQTGSNEFRFRPYVELDFQKMEQVTLSAHFTATIPNTLIMVQFWNTEKQEWVEVPIDASYQVFIPEGKPLIDPTGEVRIRISANSATSSWGEIEDFELTMKVQP